MNNRGGVGDTMTIRVLRAHDQAVYARRLDRGLSLQRLECPDAQGRRFLVRRLPRHLLHAEFADDEIVDQLEFFAPVVIRQHSSRYVTGDGTDSDHRRTSEK